jgi:hypothetical protein
VDQSVDPEAKIGFLSNLDNFRIEVKLFNEDTIRRSFAHQSFSIAGEGNKMTMRPTNYVDPKTSKYVSKELTFPSLGVNCFQCHASGSRFSPRQLDLMRNKDYTSMEGFKEFLSQMKEWGASNEHVKKTEKLMKSKGPIALLPLDDMIRANQEQWITIYPRYQERKRLSSQVAR